MVINAQQLVSSFIQRQWLELETSAIRGGHYSFFLYSSPSLSIACPETTVNLFCACRRSSKWRVTSICHYYYSSYFSLSIMFIVKCTVRYIFRGESFVRFWKLVDDNSSLSGQSNVVQWRIRSLRQCACRTNLFTHGFSCREKKNELDWFYLRCSFLCIE